MRQGTQVGLEDVAGGTVLGDPALDAQNMLTRPGVSANPSDDSFHFWVTLAILETALSFPWSPLRAPETFRTSKYIATNLFDANMTSQFAFGA